MYVKLILFNDLFTQKSRSPLHIAVESGHTDIINMLITHGANVDKEDMVRNLYNRHMYCMPLHIVICWC